MEAIAIMCSYIWLSGGLEIGLHFTVLLFFYNILF